VKKSALKQSKNVTHEYFKVNTKQDLIKQASSVLKTHTSKIGKKYLVYFFLSAVCLWKLFILNTL